MRAGTVCLLAVAAAASAPLTAQGVTDASPVVSASLREIRKATLEDLATKLEQRFVFPETGRKYAMMIRANAASGKYADIADDAEFGRRVTADLHDIAFDGHLKLIPRPKQASTPGAVHGAHNLPDTIEAQARIGDIAYIRLAKFFGEPEEVAAVKKFVEDNLDSKTIIFDVRTHMGGGLDEMDAIFPYLFDRETVLVGMDTRVGVTSPLENGARLREVAAPDSVVRREHFVVPTATPSPLAKAKVFVLTSGRTGSAGEHFVLSLKRTGRATVIGETTYGAGNFGRTEQIEGGFSAFIPVGRTFDPDTDKGWDYVGVAPHIAVPAAHALTEALVRSGVARAEAEAFAAKYGPAPKDVTSMRKAPASVAGI